MNAPSRGGSRRGETILLVEDDRSLLDLVQLILEEAGYNVVRAMDGQEAVDIYRRRAPEIDLVFTDMGLPKLCGKEELVMLRQINPGVKIILWTGLIDPKLRLQMLDAGASDFVFKSFSPGEVLDVVRRVLDSN